LRENSPDLLPSANCFKAFGLCNIEEPSSVRGILPHNTATILSDPGIDGAWFLSDLKYAGTSLEESRSVTSKAGLAALGKFHALVDAPEVVIVIVTTRNLFNCLLFN
jgi:hypothetical protein